jgi:hypothetical protein
MKDEDDRTLVAFRVMLHPSSFFLVSNAQSSR